jgi:hypothetical protein
MSMDNFGQDFGLMTKPEKWNEAPFICKCGVDLSKNLCLCPAEGPIKTEDAPPTFSPDVLMLAIDLQKKIDRIKKGYTNVTVSNMKANVSFTLSAENPLKILDETDSDVTCSVELVAFNKMLEKRK